MRLFVTLFICTLSSIASCQYSEIEPQIFNEKTGALSPKTYAIVIGVADYTYLGENKQLEWADNDALSMVDYLKTQDNVELYLYTNADATDPLTIGKKIHEVINKKAGQMDRVLIYFSGHGDISEVDNNGYLLLSNVEKPTDTPYSWSDAIPIDKIKSTILSPTSQVSRKNVYLIFDACKSGFAQNPPVTANYAEHQKIVLLLSSQAHEKSNEDDELEHGVFSYYLIQGLKGLANLDDGNEITLDELRTYVIANVTKKTANAQNPLFNFQEGTKVIGKFSEESLNDATRDISEKINVASVGGDKGSEEPVNTISSKCQQLLELLEKQSASGIFFPDEIDQNSSKLLTGSINEVYNAEGSLKSVVSSRTGKWFGLIENGLVNLYKSSDFKNGIGLNTSELIESIAISPNENTLATASESGIIQLWSTSTGDALAQSILIDEEISTLQFISDALVAAGTVGGKLILIDLNSGGVEKFKLHKGRITDISVFNSSLYTQGDDGQVSIFDLVSKSRTKSFSGKNTDFALLTDQNKLLTIRENQLVVWDLSTNKELKTLEFGSELRSVEIDPFEQYAIVGGENKTIEIVELFNFVTIKSKFRTQGIPSTIEFLERENKLLITEANGVISTLPFEVDMKLAAFNIRQLLNQCGEIQDLQNQIDGQMVLGLNKQVVPVIRALIKTEGEGISSEEIKNAKRYAKKAFELGKDQVLDPERLEINMLLLDVYEILLEEDTKSYQVALERIERILELDPNGSYAFNVAAELYLKLNNPEKAKEALKQAEEVAPNWATPKLKTGEIFIEEKKFEEAKMKIAEVLALDEEHAQAHADLATVQLLTGDIEGAAVSYIRAQELDKNVELSDTVVNSFNLAPAVPKVRSTSEFGFSSNKTKKSVNNSDPQNENVDLRDGLQVGDFYEGGTVFYIDGTGKHGLVAAYQSKYNAMTWDEGMNMCLKMELNGFDDWHMPTISEMKTFATSPIYAPVEVFWTATLNYMFPGNVFWFDTKNKIEDFTPKENRRFVLPIRAF